MFLTFVIRRSRDHLPVYRYSENILTYD